MHECHLSELQNARNIINVPMGDTAIQKAWKGS